MIISNTEYQKLPTLPVDGRGPRAIAGALSDAKFAVISKENLDLDSLIDILDKFQLSIQRDDVCLVYYSGYAIRKAGRTFLLPKDFDPESNEDQPGAYVTSRLLNGMAERRPFLSMVILDASWDAPELSGQTGIATPTPPSLSWIFASAHPNQRTLEAPDHIGLFTSALTKALSQHGVDLTDLKTMVTEEVKVASAGKQIPQAWETDVPRFRFHPVVPIRTPFQNRKDREQYVYIPAGKFWMGCAPNSEKCNPDEKPRHAVEITRGFWLGQNEVTQDDFMAFKPTWRHPGTNMKSQGNVPVTRVSWEEAQRYCQAAGGRLPTEAEWERAARDGKDDEIYPFPDIASAYDKAKFKGNRKGGSYNIAPVRKFDPSRQYGLYDMAGNVWEWVSDWYAANFYERSAKEAPSRDPENSDYRDTKHHVARGGSWMSDPNEHLRISYRKSADPGNTVGFRCVLPDTPEVRAQLGFSQ